MDSSITNLCLLGVLGMSVAVYETFWKGEEPSLWVLVFSLVTSILSVIKIWLILITQRGG